MITAGELDRKVTIQAKTTTTDAFGGIVETWADDSTRWAKKIEQGGREFRAAGAINADVTTIFKMRYSADLTAQHRLSYGGRTYEILGITEGNERGREMLVQTRVNP